MAEISELAIKLKIIDIGNGNDDDDGEDKESRCLPKCPLITKETASGPHKFASGELFTK